jgi:septum formation protein
MDMLGVAYEVRPSNIDEKALRERDPAELTRTLAEAKAWKIVGESPDAIVVSGDAVAAKDGRVFEKPRDVEEAAAFLRELSCSTFQFVTSLAVVHGLTRKMLATVEISNISFLQDLEEI